jgi:hypothetical protein
LPLRVPEKNKCLKNLFKNFKAKFSFQAGLPDGFFLDQKSQFGYILEDLGMENVVTYSCHLEYFTTIRHSFGHLAILWSFSFFPRFGILYQ